MIRHAGTCRGLTRRPITPCTMSGTRATIANVFVMVRTMIVSQNSAGIPASAKAATMKRLVASGAMKPANRVSTSTVRRRSKRRGLGQNSSSAQAPSTASVAFATYWITTCAIGLLGQLHQEVERQHHEQVQPPALAARQQERGEKDRIRRPERGHWRGGKCQPGARFGGEHIGEGGEERRCGLLGKAREPLEGVLARVRRRGRHVDRHRIPRRVNVNLIHRVADYCAIPEGDGTKVPFTGNWRIFIVIQ